MICAKLSEAGNYLGIHPRLDQALGLLTEAYLQTVPTQRRELDGDRLFVTRFDVQTSTDEGRLFEYHRRYADIFVLTAGAERVDIASPEVLTVREQHDDYWGCAGSAQQQVTLTPGSFLVLLPGEGHRPGMALSEPENIKRIVFKILLTEV